jgi:hypothetical protein
LGWLLEATVKIEFTVTVKDNWHLDQWPKRIENGLTSAGNAWMNETKLGYGRNARSGGTYARTGALKDKTTFRVSGLVVELLSIFYYTYLLLGTGVFGPKHAPIVPTSAPFLAWKSTGNVANGEWIHAKSVQGTIWAGQLEAVKKALSEKFAYGLKKPL